MRKLSALEKTLTQQICDQQIIALVLNLLILNGILFCFIFFFWLHCTAHVGSQFPNQGSNPHPLQWKHRVLTAGPPGKSPCQHLFFFFNIFIGVQLLQNVVLVSAVQQSESAICIHLSPYPLPLASSSHPPYPTPQVVTKHRADLPVLCSCFPLAIYFTFGSVYMSMPLSHFVPA